MSSGHDPAQLEMGSGGVWDLMAVIVRTIERRGWTPDEASGPTVMATHVAVADAIGAVAGPDGLPDVHDWRRADQIRTWIRTSWADHDCFQPVLAAAVTRDRISLDWIELLAWTIAEYHYHHPQPSSPTPLRLGNKTPIEGTVALYGWVDGAKFPPRPTMTLCGGDGWQASGTIPATILPNVVLGTRIRLIADTTATSDPHHTEFGNVGTAEVLDHPDDSTRPSPWTQLYKPADPVSAHGPAIRPPRPATVAQINYIQGLLDDLDHPHQAVETPPQSWATGLIDPARQPVTLDQLHLDEAAHLIDVLKIARDVIRAHRLETPTPDTLPDLLLAAAATLTLEPAPNSRPLDQVIAALPRLERNLQPRQPHP